MRPGPVFIRRSYLPAESWRQTLVFDGSLSTGTLDLMNSPSERYSSRCLCKQVESLPSEYSIRLSVISSPVLVWIEGQAQEGNVDCHQSPLKQSSVSRDFNCCYCHILSSNLQLLAMRLQEPNPLPPPSVS